MTSRRRFLQLVAAAVALPKTLLAKTAPAKAAPWPYPVNDPVSTEKIQAWAKQMQSDLIRDTRLVRIDYRGVVFNPDDFATIVIDTYGGTNG